MIERISEVHKAGWKFLSILVAKICPSYWPVWPRTDEHASPLWLMETQTPIHPAHHWGHYQWQWSDSWRWTLWPLQFSHSHIGFFHKWRPTARQGPPRPSAWPVHHIPFWTWTFQWSARGDQIFERGGHLVPVQPENCGPGGGPPPLWFRTWSLAPPDAPPPISLHHQSTELLSSQQTGTLLSRSKGCCKTQSSGKTEGGIQPARPACTLSGPHKGTKNPRTSRHPLDLNNCNLQ